ncbi:MAG: argininosuccinate lyase [Candidatus Flemingibacterium sp.]|nr:argininosuccinate lyase [Candidatus Flemingibacterium sp.]
MKLWSGRFKKDVDSRVNDINSSISFDGRMYKQDIEGSIAHATMLGECGIIEKHESEKIVEALKGILADIEAGRLEFSADAEDIHMNIETILTERIGDTGKRLHTARSRNDQVALDIRMYLLDETKLVKARVLGLLAAISEKAKANVDTVMAGYTHLQRAQPVTFAHYILAYAQMLMRDYDRICDCEKRMRVMPLGSGALASTTYPINRERVAELLGFPKVTENSIDGVSDRDFVIELASALSILMMHMSRFSEEIILWCSSEFGFIELDDAFSTGSSIMPQKKNPDVAELVRGKTGRIYGDLMTLLTMMKSLPLAYNKDMQEDKEAIFDAIDNTLISIEVFTSMFATMTVRADRLRKAAAKGFINATDCADYLVKKGMPFRDAYKVSGTLVRYCVDNDKTLEDLTLDEYKAVCDLFDDGVYEAINLENCVNGRKVHGGPAKESVLYQIGLVDRFLEDNK